MHKKEAVNLKNKSIMIHFKFINHVKKIKIVGLQFLLFNQLFFCDLYQQRYLIASEALLSPSSEYINNIPKESFYILGPGDVLELKVSNYALDLSGPVVIDGEGIATLERLNRIYVSGLTIKELIPILNKEYSKYVKDPNVEIIVRQYRPIKIYLDGEIVDPGYHVLPGEFNAIVKDSEVPLATTSELLPRGYPTVIDGIRKAEGVTLNSNLENIKVIRDNSISNGGGKIQTTVNILEGLKLGDNSQNIRLYDGDRIYISKSETPLLSQMSKVIASNINPKFVKVYLSGRVENSGELLVSKRSVLTDAIKISGGAKVLKGPVRFLRYNNDGTIDSRTFGLNNSAERGSYKNPYLKNGDLIFIGKSPLNVVNEVFSEITAPFQGIFATYGFYETFRSKD